MNEAMYSEHARYYDLIYSWKDYRKESEEILKIITKHGRSKGKDLLDVGCGTGKHLEQFKTYTRTGVDLNTGILTVAKTRLPKASFYAQDMSKLDLKGRYDVITCLFSAIGYVKTERALKETIRKFSNHLKPGGIVIIEPWLTKDIYVQGRPHITVYDGKEIKISRMNISKVKGNFSVLDFTWCVAEQGKKMITFRDIHMMRMTSIEDLLAMMQQAGLQTRFIKSESFSRGLLIGVKPSA